MSKIAVKINNIIRWIYILFHYNKSFEQKKCFCILCQFCLPMRMSIFFKKYVNLVHKYTYILSTHNVTKNYNKYLKKKSFLFGWITSTSLNIQCYKKKVRKNPLSLKRLQLILNPLSNQMLNIPRYDIEILIKSYINRWQLLESLKKLILKCRLHFDEPNQPVGV